MKTTEQEQQAKEKKLGQSAHDDLVRFFGKPSTVAEVFGKNASQKLEPAETNRFKSFINRLINI